MDELVFAIPTLKLWDLLTYKKEGLIYGNSDVLGKIIQNGLFRSRNKLEEDATYKQVITYAIISSKESYYLFKRSSKQTEKRLHNQLTLGVGGHMNPSKSMELKKHYITNELKREFFEEVNLLKDCHIKSIEFIGFINDDTIPVGKVHIGLLYNIRVSNKNISIKETDKMTADWVKKKSLAEFYEEMETWSKIIFDHHIK